MRILYLPIIEGGANHDVALLNKRGLHDALVNAGHTVTQYDYLADDGGAFWAYVGDSEPELLLTQFHGANVITPTDLESFRALLPNCKVVNWSGDSWLHSLTGEPMIELLRHVDLQLVAAPAVLPKYAEMGILARFWQIAYEKPVGELPDVPEYDIVYLANAINDKRRELMTFLKSLPYRVGIYGDWEQADGACTYDFGYGEALYKKAKIAIADMSYPEQQSYISNRPIQVMMARGAILFHEYVEDMELLSNGWKNGIHYVKWSHLEDLKHKIHTFMNAYDGEYGFVNRLQKEMAYDGYRHARKHHTYDVRVKQLFEEYMPLIGVTV